MKRSRQAYYDKYFETKWNNNIKNTWKGIKSFISLKTVASSVPTIPSLDNGDTITNSYDIASTFIAESTKKSIKYSHKNFQTILQVKIVIQYFSKPLIKKIILCKL